VIAGGGRMVKEPGKVIKILDRDTHKAVGRVAAGYKFVLELYNDLEAIEREKDTQKAIKEVKKGIMILRWVGRAEAKIDKAEKKILADLAELQQTGLPAALRTDNLKLAQQLAVAEATLVRLASTFRGKIKGELQEIMTDEALLEEYQENIDKTQKIQHHLAALCNKTKEELKELERWIGTTEQILRSITGFGQTLKRLQAGNAVMNRAA